MSPKLAVASPPFSVISSTTSRSGSSFAPSPWGSEPRSLTTTLAPRSAIRTAVSRPRPLAPPVTMTTLPSIITAHPGSRRSPRRRPRCRGPSAHGPPLVEMADESRRTGDQRDSAGDERIEPEFGHPDADRSRRIDQRTRPEPFFGRVLNVEDELEVWTVHPFGLENVENSLGPRVGRVVFGGVRIPASGRARQRCHDRDRVARLAVVDPRDAVLDHFRDVLHRSEERLSRAEQTARDRTLPPLALARSRT